MDPDNDTEGWTNICDRGGLTHVNDMTYQLFRQMEIELHECFNFKAAVTEPTSKQLIIKKISENEEVLHQWHSLTEDQGYDLVIIDELYHIMITEFVTLRGFYFAASIVETYKKISVKNLQKSKGLRKTIIQN